MVRVNQSCAVINDSHLLCQQDGYAQKLHISALSAFVYGKRQK